jgi:hypothetical protein
MASEVVSVNGAVMKSGELLRVMARNREDERGTEMDLGFGGGGASFIGNEGRRRRSLRCTDDERHQQLHRAAFRSEEDDDLFGLNRNGMWANFVVWADYWWAVAAGLWSSGLPFIYFSSFVSFLFVLFTGFKSSI